MTLTRHKAKHLTKILYKEDYMHSHIELFGILIPGYGLFAAIGFLFVPIFLYFQKYYSDLDFDTALIGLVMAISFSAFGAKLLYWITYPKPFGSYLIVI